MHSFFPSKSSKISFSEFFSSNQRHSNFHVIYDAKSIGSKNINLTTVRDYFPVFNSLGSYFPEALHRMYIINLGFAMMGIWKVIASLMNPRTKTKVTVVGANEQKKLKEAFLKVADEKVLPTFLGGKNDKVLEPE